MSLSQKWFVSDSYCNRSEFRNQCSFRCCIANFFDKLNLKNFQTVRDITHSLPEVSWNSKRPVSNSCWFGSSIINKNRLSTEPREFFIDGSRFNVTGSWTNSWVGIYVWTHIIKFNSRLKSKLNSPEKPDMIRKNFIIASIFGIRSTVPSCPFLWVLTNWIIWYWFSNLC